MAETAPTTPQGCIDTPIDQSSNSGIVTPGFSVTRSEQAIIIDASSVGDVLDDLLSSENSIIETLIEYLDGLTLSVTEEGNGIELLYIRIAKLINYVVQEVISISDRIRVDNIPSIEVATLKCNVRNVTQILQAVLRYMYIAKHSDVLSDYTAISNNSIAINIDASFSITLPKLLIDLGKDANLAIPTPFEFRNHLKHLWLFLITSQTPYVMVDSVSKAVIEANTLFSNGIDVLFSDLGSSSSIRKTDQAIIHIELLKLSYFANNRLAGASIISNFTVLSQQLECFLRDSVDAKTLTDKQYDFLIEVTQLLCFVGTNEIQLRTLLFTNRMHVQIYDKLKQCFIAVQSKQQPPFKYQNLIQQLLILLRVQLTPPHNSEYVNSYEEFIEQIFNDFSSAITNSQYALIHSVIHPILIESRRQIPICLHKQIRLDQLIEFNDKLKSMSNAVEEGEPKDKKSLVTKLFNPREKSFFIDLFHSKNAGLKQGTWSQLYSINSIKNNPSCAEIVPILSNQRNTLFLFQCKLDGDFITIGAYVSSKFTEYKKKSNAHAMDDIDVNLLATSNQSSFYFRVDESQMLHVPSTIKSMKREGIDEPVQIGHFLSDMKTYVSIEYSGITFYLDNKPAAFVNFSNIDKSTFSLPFYKAFTQQSRSVFQTDAILVSAEVWQFEEDSAETNQSSLLEMFSHPVDFQAQYLQQMQSFRYESLFLASEEDYLSQHFTENDLEDEQVIIASAFESNVEMMSQVRSLEYVYDAPHTQSILDLAVVKPSDIRDVMSLRVNEYSLEDPFPLENMTSYPQGAEQARDSLFKGFSRILSQFNSIAESNNLVPLQALFKDAQSILGAAKWSLINNKEEEIYFNERNKFILPILCRVFENYIGIQKASSEGKANKSSNNSNQQAPASASLSSGLKGVGYGAGGSDMSWTQNYEGMVEANSSQTTDKKSNDTAGISVAVEEYNAYSVIQKHLDRDLLDCRQYVLGNRIGMVISIQQQLAEQLSSCELFLTAVHDVKLHLILMGYLEQSPSILLSGSVIQKVLFIIIIQTIEKISEDEDLQELLITCSDDDCASENEDQNEDKCVYTMLVEIKSKLDFLVESRTLFEGNDDMQMNYEKIISQIEAVFENLEKAGLLEDSEDEDDAQQNPIQSEENNEADGEQADETDLHALVPLALQPKCVTKSPFVKDNHHYKNALAQFEGFVPSSAQVQRMVQEIAGMQNSLEARSESAIFICYDETKMNYMRCLVFGAQGTPYAHGGFVYDMLLPQNYPQSPPSVNLTTTGQAAVRFNPNLYHCGKVCLSLLGTWRGVISESWNPKISSILQLLISLQAIVMSEYVYFNEPGYEGSAGTPEGEQHNIGYSNIVRIGNIRHAMIDQIRNPLPEFKEIILTMFYLKKHVILEECKAWQTQASAQAQYSGLVNSHNPTMCTEIAEKGYESMLADAVKELEKAFEELKLKVDVERLSLMKSKMERKKSKVVVRKEKRLSTATAATSQLPRYSGEEAEKNGDEAAKQTGEDIDGIIAQFFEKDELLVKEFESSQQKADDGYTVNEANSFGDLSREVTDRWSRYIGVLGLDSVKKQSMASVLIVGLDNVGVEVAKNIALSGVKMLGLADTRRCDEVKSTTIGQFFLSNATHSKLNVAEQTLIQIRQLNEYVQCCVDNRVLENSIQEQSLKQYTTVVVVNQRQEVTKRIAETCRHIQVGVVVVENRSVFARIVTDFGQEFTVLDQNGEQVLDHTISSIEETGDEVVVKLTQGLRHGFTTQSVVSFREVVDVESKEEKKSINGEQLRVRRIIDTNSFSIHATVGEYREYLRNGIVKEVKQPITIRFNSISEQLSTPRFDEGVCGDCTDAVRKSICIAFNAADVFFDRQLRYPRAWSIEDAEQFCALAMTSHLDAEQQDKATLNRILSAFSLTFSGYLPAQGSVVGGIVAQEVIKSITQKWMPISQTMVHSCEEILLQAIAIDEFIDQPSMEQQGVSIKSELLAAAQNLGFLPTGDKYDPIRVILGQKHLDSLMQASTFVVGAGAIGCELLKNLAMSGFATASNATITITDPDVIENSNLNRQFLFRTQHITKPKASVSAAAAIHMNSDLRGHVIARLEKVYDGSEGVFNDAFFGRQQFVLNALDNVQARKYVDRRCVSTQIPMIDSGTLGSKGHVQVVVPHLTESYGNQADPVEEGDIPQCTLKMFPENDVHCMEWARDKFGRMFAQKPSSLERVLSFFKAKKSLHEIEEKVLREAVAGLRQAPLSFSDCITYALKKFYKLFNINIKQLLHVYPLDHKNKDGSLFWTLPKRPPVPLIFDVANPSHRQFVLSLARLKANVYGFNYAKAEDSEYAEMIEERVINVAMPVFVASEEKGNQLKEANAAGQKKEGLMEEQETVVVQKAVKQSKSDIVDQIMLALSEEGQCLSIFPQEFEKDNDSNHHVDCVHAMTNCRGENYQLASMPWIDVKIKAGRITPALVTTTAIVAGLQVLEAIKLAMRVRRASVFRNSFINISLPSFVQSEPFEAPIVELTEQLKVTVWDRWEVKITELTNTIEKLFKYFIKEYKLFPRDIIQGAKPIYIESLMSMPNNLLERKGIRNKQLSELFTLKNSGDRHVDVVVTFSDQSDSEVLLDGVPLIRLYFL